MTRPFAFASSSATQRQGKRPRMLVLRYSSILGCRHRSWLREKPDFLAAPKSHDSGYILIPSYNEALGALLRDGGRNANSRQLFGGFVHEFLCRCNRLFRGIDGLIDCCLLRLEAGQFLYES